MLAFAASSPHAGRSRLKDECVAIQLPVLSVLSYESCLFSVLAGRSVLADFAQCYACWTTERFVLRRGRPGSVGPRLNVESVGSAVCMKCDDNNNNADNNEFSRAGRRAYLNLFIPFHSVLSMRYGLCKFPFWRGFCFFLSPGAKCSLSC